MLEGATPHPAALPPMPAVARILAQYDRDKLASFIEVAIGLLDTGDGDIDAEPATWTEAAGPRTHDSQLSEDQEAAGDERDVPWPEWHTRGRHKLAAGDHEPVQRGGHEDDEDDDPDTGVEDDPPGFDPEEDMCPRR